MSSSATGNGVNQRVPWLRVLVEGVVIVGSILLAFGIDAAWDGRQERERTRRHLEALIREVRQTQEEIRREIEGVESSREGTAAVLQLMRSPNAVPTPDELANAVVRSLDVGVFTAQHPVMTTMLTSGELLELGNEALFGLLGQWRSEIEHLRIDAEHLERNREEVILERSIALGVPFEIFEPRPPLLAILRDPGMEAAFALRGLRAALLAGSYARALETADRVVAALEGALDD